MSLSLSITNARTIHIPILDCLACHFCVRWALGECYRLAPLCSLDEQRMPCSCLRDCRSGEARQPTRGGTVSETIGVPARRGDADRASGGVSPSTVVWWCGAFRQDTPFSGLVWGSVSLDGGRRTLRDRCLFLRTGCRGPPSGLGRRLGQRLVWGSKGAEIYHRNTKHIFVLGVRLQQPGNVQHHTSTHKKRAKNLATQQIDEFPLLSCAQCVAGQLGGTPPLSKAVFQDLVVDTSLMSGAHL